jgi:outer membrane protein assembly factor BamB
MPVPPPSNLSHFVTLNRAPVLVQDAVLVVGGSDAGPRYVEWVECLDRGTGTSRWRFSPAEGGHWSVCSTPVCSGGRVFVGWNDGGLYALEARSGAVAWRHQHGTTMAVPCVAGGLVVCADESGRVAQIAEGRVLREVRSTAPGIPSPCAAGVALWGTDGSVRVFDRDLRERWGGKPLPSGGPVIACGETIVSRAPARAVALRAEDGVVAWEVVGETAIGGDESLVVLGNDQGGLAARDPVTGRDRWRSAKAPPGAVHVGAGLVCFHDDERVAVLRAESGEAIGDFALDAAQALGPAAGDAAQVVAVRGRVPSRDAHAVALRPGAAAWQVSVGGYGLS